MLRMRILPTGIRTGMRRIRIRRKVFIPMENIMHTIMRAWIAVVMWGGHCIIRFTVKAEKEVMSVSVRKDLQSICVSLDLVSGLRISLNRVNPERLI